MIDTLYDISCRIQHIPSCHDIRKYSNIIKFHFENLGGPIMCGGDLDASSKCIAGIHIVHNDAYLLIVVSIMCLIHVIKNVCVRPRAAFCCCELFSFVLLVHFYHLNAVARRKGDSTSFVVHNLEVSNAFVHIHKHICRQDKSKFKGKNGPRNGIQSHADTIYYLLMSGSKECNDDCKTVMITTMRRIQMQEK